MPWLPLCLGGRWREGHHPPGFPPYSPSRATGLPRFTESPRRRTTGSIPGRSLQDPLRLFPVLSRFHRRPLPLSPRCRPSWAGKTCARGPFPAAEARGPGSRKVGGGHLESQLPFHREETPSLSLLPWQVRDPRSEVLHGQHSPHTDPVQKRAGEVRTTKAPGTWRGGRAGLRTGVFLQPPSLLP